MCESVIFRILRRHKYRAETLRTIRQTVDARSREVPFEGTLLILHSIFPPFCLKLKISTFLCRSASPVYLLLLLSLGTMPEFG